ncbi:MAG TPA: cyclic nucleotide-binding domain-containing protein [Kofleriaceae bacterium]|nr:cyclic nucleotide-binding domain-containing protein [Kofleriaceae bacterium]
MARDIRQLRAEASEATASGKYKRALAAYLELERLEPRDAQWSKRVAETYRRLGKDKDAIGAYARSVDRYAQSGFLVQAIAVCKLILQIDPKNDDALQRLASMNEQVGQGPTRAMSMVDANPKLAEDEKVQALRAGRGSGLHAAHTDGQRPRGDTLAPPIAIARKVTPEALAIPRKFTPDQLAVPRKNTPVPVAVPSAQDESKRNRNPNSTPPPLSIPRTKSKPISLPPDQPIESISLKDEVPDSFEREENSGVYVIPIDGEGAPEDATPIETAEEYSEPLAVEIDAPDDDSDMSVDAIEDSTELEIDDIEDIEDIPLPEPRIVGIAAAEALASTPLFAGLSQEALGSLVQQLTLVHLAKDEILFHEGDPGDALYVICEGEVSVSAEGPPRVEMARMGAGAFIGEVALMTDQPRSATVTATLDAELLRIDRKTLSMVLATHGEVLSAVLRFVRDRLVDRWQRTSPLFRPFDAGQRAEIAARFKFLEIEPGTKLLTPNKRPDGLYIVLAGRFFVKRGGSNVATVGPGELIGETALLAGGVFQSEVIAAGKSLALCLPAGDFRDLILTHPQVLEYIGEAAEHSRKLQIL